MLRAMTKPALMTFRNIYIINCYFNAKFTNFQCSHIDFTLIWLTHCSMQQGYGTHYELLHGLL